MKPTVTISLVAGLLAIGAGVAIAGLPVEPPGDGLIITAAPSVATTTTLPAVVDTVSPLPTTTSTTTTPEPTTATEPTTTTEPDDDASTTVSTAGSLTPRDELSVVTVNGAGVNGIAGSTATELETLGYAAVQTTDAPALADRSTVYYGDTLAAEAASIADALGWSTDAVAPIDSAPEIIGTGSFDIVVVIGLDQSGPLDGL